LQAAGVGLLKEMVLSFVANISSLAAIFWNKKQIKRVLLNNEMEGVHRLRVLHRQEKNMQECYFLI
jgi:hypothetical protein